MNTNFFIQIFFSDQFVFSFRIVKNQNLIHNWKINIEKIVDSVLESSFNHILRNIMSTFLNSYFYSLLC